MKKTALISLFAITAVIGVGGIATTALADSVHATPGHVLAEYTRQAGAGADPVRGHALLDKLELGATSPEFQPVGPVNHDKLEQWFNARCLATLNRVCTPLEKADVAAWLIKEQASATKP